MFIQPCLLWDRHTEGLSCFCLSCVVGQWLGPTQSEAEAISRLRENNVLHFSRVLEPKSGCNLLLLNWTLYERFSANISSQVCEERVSLSPLTQLIPARCPEHHSRGISESPSQKWRHSSLTNFFFSTHVDSLEIGRKSLAKVTGFYSFLCKKKKCSLWKINCIVSTI